MKGLLVLAGVVIAASAQTFPIAGVIVNAQSGSPMTRARIVLASSEARSSLLFNVTGDDGHFSFDVPRGKYGLTAEWGGLRQTFGIGEPGTGFGVAIITGADQDTAHLTFRWHPFAAVTGKVIDDRGEPVEDALVQVIHSSISGGHKRLVTYGWFRTDDRGVYRVAPLTAGTYYLAVTAEPWYVAKENHRGIRKMANSASEPTPAYAPNYYPGASDFSGATAVVVTPGAEVQADFTLRTIVGARVLVKCPDYAGGEGTLSLISEGLEGARGFQAEVDFHGTQTIAGVPPGRYDVRIAGAGDNPFAARKTIDVGSSDVTVELTVQPPPSVSGRLTFAGPAAHPKSTVYVRLVSEVTGRAIARALEPDGSFAFNNVAIGRCRPRISGAEGFQISQATAEGGNLRDGVLDVIDGAAITLNLVVNDETGRVKGFAVDGDKPVAGMLVVLAPRIETADTSQYQGFQTDSDGSFDFPNVRVGDYVLFAIPKLDLEYANPIAVKPYLAAGKPIRVERHGTNDERVPVIAQPSASFERRRRFARLPDDGRPSVHRARAD